MLALILGVGLLVSLLLVMRAAARRYEARQRTLGKWDEYGPLIETEAPPREGYYEGSLSERAEVIGRWQGKILRLRRPHEKP